MKKIIGIVIASLMFANIGFAEMRIIEDTAVGPTDSNTYIVMSTMCVDGHKFVLHGTDSIVQFYEWNANYGLPIPATC